MPKYTIEDATPDDIQGSHACQELDDAGPGDSDFDRTESENPADSSGSEA